MQLLSAQTRTLFTSVILIAWSVTAYDHMALHMESWHYLHVLVTKSCLIIRAFVEKVHSGSKQRKDQQKEIGKLLKINQIYDEVQ